MDIKDSFITWCKKRVGPLEVGMCPTYADVAVMGVSPSVNDPSIGDTKAVCNGMFMFISAAKQAEIDMKLIKSALPASLSLIARSLGHFGTGGVGPDSPRGRRWREYAWQRFGPGARADSEAEVRPRVTSVLPAGASLVQEGWGAAVWAGNLSFVPSPNDGSESGEDARGMPKYNPTAPAVGVQAETTAQSGTKYQIAPGSADGTVPPTEVEGDLFNYCTNQVSEIQMGFPQKSFVTAKMAEDWCMWQASTTTWVGKKDEVGHPDWNPRTCDAMSQLVAFALRNTLDSDQGVSPYNVCSQLFLGLSQVHRVDQLVKEGFTTALRSPPSFTAPNPSDDPEMKKMLKAAQSYADSIFGRLRGQKAAVDKFNAIKMDTKAWEKQPQRVAPEQKQASSLPDSTDFNPDALSLATVGRSRLRRWGNSGK